MFNKSRDYTIKNRFSLRKSKSLSLVPVLLGGMLVVNSGVSASADEVSSTDTVALENQIQDLSKNVETDESELNSVSNDINSTNTDLEKVNTEFNEANTSYNDAKSQLDKRNEELSTAQSELTNVDTSIKNFEENSKSSQESLKNEIAEQTRVADEEDANIQREIADTPAEVKKDIARDVVSNLEASYLLSLNGNVADHNAKLNFVSDEIEDVEIPISTSEGEKLEEDGYFEYNPNRDEYTKYTVDYIKKLRQINGIPLELPPLTSEASDYAQRRAEELKALNNLDNHESAAYSEETKKHRSGENIGFSRLYTAYGATGSLTSALSDDELAYTTLYNYMSEYYNVDKGFGHAENVLTLSTAEGVGFGLALSVGTDADGRSSRTIFDTMDGYNPSGYSRYNLDEYYSKVDPVKRSLKEVTLSDGSLQLQYNGKPVVFLPHKVYHYTYMKANTEALNKINEKRIALESLRNQIADKQSALKALESSKVDSSLLDKKANLEKTISDLKESINTIGVSDKSANLENIKAKKSELDSKLNDLNSKKSSAESKLNSDKAKLEELKSRLMTIKKEREEAERKAKEEAERKAKEEAERKAKEEAERKEAERKAQEEKAKKEEAERKAKEEQAKKEEAERKAKEEADKKAKEESERKAKEEQAKKEEADKKAQDDKTKQEDESKSQEDKSNQDSKPQEEVSKPQEDNSNKEVSKPQGDKSNQEVSKPQEDNSNKEVSKPQGEVSKPQEDKTNQDSKPKEEVSKPQEDKSNKEVDNSNKDSKSKLDSELKTAETNNTIAPDTLISKDKVKELVADSKEVGNSSHTVTSKTNNVSLLGDKKDSSSKPTKEVSNSGLSSVNIGTALQENLKFADSKPSKSPETGVSTLPNTGESTLPNTGESTDSATLSALAYTLLGTGLLGMLVNTKVSNKRR